LTEPIRLSAPLELKAAEESALPSRFGGIAYSGGLVPGFGIVIDLSTTKLSQRMPMLSEHNRSDAVGVADVAAVHEHKLTIAGKLFSDMPGSTAERIAMLSQRGMPFEMSVGIFDASYERVPPGKDVAVNGATFQGPVTVLRNGSIREVSIVTLGADADTIAQFFNRPSNGAAMSTEQQLTAQVAELTAQLAASKQAEAVARAEGAAAERERIKAVEASLLPGHEALILSLKYDGKTTAPEAAVAILAAERELRGKAATLLAGDAPKPAKPAATPAIELAAADPMADTSKPVEERCKAKWESDPKVRAEFSTLESFTALTRAEEAGKVRVLGAKRAA
jgi:hypothetical protein